MITLESINIIKLVKCVSSYTQNKKKIFISIAVVNIQNHIFPFYSFFFGIFPTQASFSKFYFFICLLLFHMSRSRPYFCNLFIIIIILFKVTLYLDFQDRIHLISFIDNCFYQPLFKQDTNKCMPHNNLLKSSNLFKSWRFPA